MNNERVSPEALKAFWPDRIRAHERAQNFIKVNGLKDRLRIGSKIGEGLLLEDSLAIESVSEQVGPIESKIRKRRLGGLSRRRVLGAYARFRIKQLEVRKTILSLAFDYLIEERKSHRDQNCRTPQQLESAGIVMRAVDDLIVITQESGGSISAGTRLKEEDLSSWQDEYRDMLYAVN